MLQSKTPSIMKFLNSREEFLKLNEQIMSSRLRSLTTKLPTNLNKNY